MFRHWRRQRNAPKGEPIDVFAQTEKTELKALCRQSGQDDMVVHLVNVHLVNRPPG